MSEKLNPEAILRRYAHEINQLGYHFYKIREARVAYIAGADAIAERDQLRAELAAAVSREIGVRTQLAEARANLAKADDDLNSAAYDLERQGRELAEARLDGARLEELYRRADVDPRGYLVFRPIQLPKNADWDGVTCKWDRDIFNAAIDAAMEGKSDDKR